MSKSIRSSAKKLKLDYMNIFFSPHNVLEEKMPEIIKQL